MPSVHYGGNPVFFFTNLPPPPPIARRVFFSGLQERQRGLRVTVLEGLPSASQPGFIDAFLLPFFTALLPMAPGLDDEYIPNLRDNRCQ